MGKYITSISAFVNRVMNDYLKDDTELCDVFFNFDVDMDEGNILLAYAEAQRRLNGDKLVHIDDNGKEVELEDVVRAGKYPDHYKGNCAEFLKKVNSGGYFVRLANEDDVLDFLYY